MSFAVTMDQTAAAQKLERPESVLTMKEIERRVAAIDVAQIQALAEGLAAKVMSRLDIDVIRHAPVAGEYMTDIEGRTFPVYLDQYHPDSQMLRALAPLIANEIASAFSTPGRFVQEGLTIKMIGPEGLLDKVKSQNLALQNTINVGTTRLQHNFDLSSVSYDLQLSLNLDFTCMLSDLYFAVDMILNRAKFGNTGGTLEVIEKRARQRVVF